MIGKELFNFFEAGTFDIGVGFNFYRENIIFALDKKIDLMRRVELTPVARVNFKLRDQTLKNKVFRERTFKFRKETISFTESARR